MVVNFWGSLFASHIIDLVLNKWTSPKYQYLQTKKKKKSSAKDSLFSQRTMTGQHNKTENLRQQPLHSSQALKNP